MSAVLSSERNNQAIRYVLRTLKKYNLSGQPEIVRDVAQTLQETPGGIPDSVWKDETLSTEPVQENEFDG